MLAQLSSLGAAVWPAGLTWRALQRRGLTAHTKKGRNSCCAPFFPVFEFCNLELEFSTHAKVAALVVVRCSFIGVEGEQLGGL